ncbi:MAG: DUF5677 domain-containing protein [Pseudolabrys sp.]|nr:DUF5677 domain-containing protein [Pseudolabrys sp.]
MSTDGERKGALGEHERRGRKYIPAMASFVKTLDGARDDAPDFMWIAMIGVMDGDALVSALVNVQRAAVQRHPGRGNKARFDGRLSTLEGWSSKDRARHLPALVKAIGDGGLLPDKVLAVLRLYENLPGGWLLVDPWADRKVSVKMDSALTLLARAIAEWSRGDHLNALTKYLTFCWAVLAGGMTWDKKFAEYMSDFPANSSRRSAAGTMIRAAYSAHQGVRDARGESEAAIANAFASKFWNFNWKITDCILASDLSTQVDVSTPGASSEVIDPEGAGPADASELIEADDVTRLVDRCAAQYTRLIDAYFDSPDRDLMHPLAEEVTSGLILRVITGAASLCRAPHQWSSQFASTNLRQLAETEIVLGWLRAHPEDFEKYRDYGLGREKLAWLHVEDLVSSLENVPEELSGVADKLERRKREAPILDVTVVSIESTFTGISLRAMAQELGMESLYRTVFQVSSGEIHGEWEPVSRENLQRCHSPLHRWHYVPSTEPPWIHDLTLPEMVVNMTERLVGIGIEMLNRSD